MIDKYIWYEVYQGAEGTSGSNTLCICKTLREVQKNKSQINLSNIHIDKWQNRDNPTILKTIE